MIYLSGVTNIAADDVLIGLGVGVIHAPANGWSTARVARFPAYAYDNGAFTNTWVEGPWLDFLAQQATERCLFAVAPDVYPDAAASLARGLRYVDLIRDLGMPAAVVAQDGAEHLAWPWDDFDCLFLGGERRPDPADEWKLSPGAARLAATARNHGKWVHMGRANSLFRLERARAMGCDSADGTFLKHGPDKNIPRMRVWLDWLATNPMFPMFSTWETHALPVHRQAARAAR